MKYVSWKVFTVPLWVILLCACTSSPPPRNIEAFADASARDFSEKEYRIQPGDEIAVKFFYNPGLNEEMTVRPDGKISLQLIPEVSASGKTPAELSQTLKKQYATALRDPAVTVMVRTFSNQRVYLDGELRQPGMVNLIKPTTLLDAIAQAGGVTETARSREILIIRRHERDERAVMTANLEKILRGEENHRDIYLQPYDIVYVPKSAIANVNQWVDQYIRQNIPLPIYIPLQ